MLNDPNNFHLIRWSEAGDSFIGQSYYSSIFVQSQYLTSTFTVPNHEQLARELLGRWFKHQRFNSFVRQLNMYGFHKIPQLQQGVLKSDSDIEVWNFAHPHFRRGEPHLLKFIQRKRQVAQAAQADAGANGQTPTESGRVLDIQSIVHELGAIKHLQSSIQAELTEVKQLNQLLWQDAIDVRAKCQKQEDTISRIVKFLAGMFGTRAGSHCMADGLNSGVFATRPRSRLMIEDGRSEKDAVRQMPGDECEDETQFVGPDGKFPTTPLALTENDLHFVIQSFRHDKRRTTLIMLLPPPVPLTLRKASTSNRLSANYPLNKSPN
jgi:heat shock transcription factor